MNTIKIDAPGVKIIAHRGLSGIERENTCPAFVAAGNRSYYGIETDIHKTKDGEFVIIHDENTERVSLGNSNINVEENIYAAVENIVLPDLDESTHRQDIRIPLLKDYIKICKKYEKVCVLEFKNPFAKEDIEAVLAQIKELEYLDHMVFISFVLENCTILRELLPEHDIQWLIKDEITEEVIETLAKYNLNLDVRYSSLTKEIVDRLHGLGLKVNCWTCDTKEDADKLVAMGVDFITTNILE